ncbi:MAG: bifunctional UDP-N-acetylglucosamine diphosphorylase/glucosamine-1-phosphate N-acetyltransferase GlmU [Chloroflexi bacterium]|nr:bifunctional UDP-N-acetylglucosamine diphosphorylase/glucosamine-1-phosphate N-acetyltransferase GlmU [Chloroflexota bacterium]
MKSTAVVLAAGHGTRMNSSLPKALHSLGGIPLIRYSVEAVQQATNTPPIVVVGSIAEDIHEAVEKTGKKIRFVTQEEQLGTGHAVQQVEPLLRNKTDFVIVTSADLPLLTVETFRMLVEEQQSNSGPMTILTLITDNPRGFGRIVRDADEHVIGIVEEAQATTDQLEINELNVGAYCFQSSWLWDALQRISLSPKGEYYLTDLVAIAVKDGLDVNALTLDDTTEAIGINNRAHLAEAEAALRQRINQRWMLSGVTILDPATTYIHAEVTIGQDTTIMPNTMLQGATTIGENCTLGPNTIITDTQIGNRCNILASVLEDAKVDNNVEIGPYCHLRKGAHLASGVHMGNFGEVKNSYLGRGVKMGHFSYLGDATIGENVNIGAGTITANYDGVNKHRTEIGADAFIGSDTMLVAPLKIGQGARTGAGSVVTKDVPDNTVVVGIPARAVRKKKQHE